MNNLQEGINAKNCSVCNELKSFDDFYKAKGNKYGFHYKCKSCCLEYNRSRIEVTRVQQTERREANRDKVNQYNNDWLIKNPEKAILKQVKNRAKRYNIEFNLDITDIIIPEVCPLLEISIIRGDKDDYSQSPSLDRIDPSKGYVKGNVRVISMKANTMKNSASKELLETFCKNIQSYYE